MKWSIIYTIWVHFGLYPWIHLVHFQKTIWQQIYYFDNGQFQQIRGSVPIEKYYGFHTLGVCRSPWISIFGVPEVIRTDGGSQFNNGMVEEFGKMMNYQHRICVAYHPQTNGLAERRMAEVMKHLRALVFTNRIKEVWSRYLSLVQRIMN
jgi:hypothetical protein